MERQLGLFKGVRQRGTRAPTATEFATQCALADLIARWIMPEWRFTHIPLGEWRDKATAARLKRMGARPGWPDFIFVGPGHVFFLELKRQGARPSDEQVDIAAHLMACGCGYLLTSSFDDAVGALRDLGIVRASVSA